MYINSINPTMNFCALNTNSLKQVNKSSNNLTIHNNMPICYNRSNINFKGKNLFMKMENFADDLTKWVKINNITSKTFENCKVYVDALHEFSPKDYNILKDALIKLRNTSYIVSDVYKNEKNAPSSYIAQCLDLEKDGMSAGIYRAYYDFKGNLIDDDLVMG